MTVKSTRRSAAFAVALALVAAPLLALTPANSAPGDEVAIFSSLPETAPPSSPSLAFQTWGINEFGSTLVLGGTERDLTRVEVAYVSWACETGYYYLTPTDPCVTTPGSGFTHPLTVSIYAENGDGTQGDLLGTVTQNAFVPYRPSADIQNCPPEGNDAPYYDAASGTCQWGVYFTVSFDFSSQGLTLPDRVIVTSAFNTSTSGYAPLGRPAGANQDGFDFLNMAIAGVVPPAVGEYVDAIFISWNTPSSPLAGPQQWGDTIYMPQIALYSTEAGGGPTPIDPTPPGKVDTAVAGLR